MSRAASRTGVIGVIVLGLAFLLLARGDAAPTVAFSGATEPSDFQLGGDLSEPFQDATRWAAGLQAYRFISQVEITTGADRETFRTDGQVRDRGTGVAPDLYAIVRLATGQIEVLRTPQGAWTRAQGQDWQALDPSREGGTIRARRIADILASVRPERTEETGDGWTITGQIEAPAVGIRSTGPVPVRLQLDEDAHVTRLDYGATFDNQGRDARLVATTIFSDFGVEQDWPATPG